MKWSDLHDSRSGVKNFITVFNIDLNRLEDGFSSKFAGAEILMSQRDFRTQNMKVLYAYSYWYGDRAVTLVISLLLKSKQKKNFESRIIFRAIVLKLVTLKHSRFYVIHKL